MNKWINGIPPVGCECEYKDLEELVWRKCEILAHKGKEIVFWDIGGEYSNNYRMASSFRPIQSQEDKEREEAISGIEAIITDGLTYKMLAEKLYDEGYRKVNPISDEDIEGRISSMIVSNDSYVRGIRTGIKWAINKMLNKKQ